MLEFIKCPACRGKKVVMGKGMLEKKCSPCLGVGHIEQKEPEEKKPPTSEEYSKIVEQQNQKDYEVFKENLGQTSKGRKPKK